MPKETSEKYLKIALMWGYTHIPGLGYIFGFKSSVRIEKRCPNTVARITTNLALRHFVPSAPSRVGHATGLLAMYCDRLKDLILLCYALRFPSWLRIAGIRLLEIQVINDLLALCGVVFQVPTMSGDKLRISTMQEIIKPNTVKRIQGYGLPFPKDTTRKGDLLVAFDIQFPEKLTAAQKDMLRDML
uniref:Chaperone DnaJ C-terminal domain-containing protein n=1 Tax=Glossina pallidipes TaxID=7398 RepID=A0A1A9ZJ62_GLOPL